MRSYRELLNFVVETFSVCTDTIDQPCTEYDTPVHDLEGIPEPPAVHLCTTSNLERVNPMVFPEEQVLEFVLVFVLK